MPNNLQDKGKPVRVGLFATIREADEVVGKLLAAGFTVKEISVLCSDDNIEQHYRQFEHQDPAGTTTPYTAATGGAIGVALGGLVGVAASIATGGLPILAAGAAAAWTGGVVGGLVGAMMSRGVEKELANYYDQEVQRGLILVAVEVRGDNQAKRLAEAERIFAEEHATPLALPEG